MTCIVALAPAAAAEDCAAPAGCTAAPRDEGARAAEGVALQWTAIPDDERWSLCAPMLVPSQSLLPSVSPEQRKRSSIDFKADQAQTDEEGQSIFIGNVLVERADQRLRADRLAYDREREFLEAQGQVEYAQSGIAAQAQHAEIDLDTEQAWLEDLTFQLPRRHAQGYAVSAEFDGPQLIYLYNATFSTCGERDRGWLLRAPKVKLNRDTGTGTAYHVTGYLRGVPIGYLPVMSFPIDDRRKTGFLVPALGLSDEVGSELRIPFYWNIAPNYDATFTPRLMSRRGVQFQNEFRYLLPRDHRGRLLIEYLPDDDVLGRDRALLDYSHTGHFTPRLSTDIELRYATDKGYFEDLGNSLSVTSLTHLERHWQLQYDGGDWDLFGQVQAFQTIDATIAAASRPYQRLPQVVFNWRRDDPERDVQYKLRTELVSFERRDSVTGQRLDLDPQVTMRLENLAAFAQPTFRLRHTQYWLHEKQPGKPDVRGRTTPIFSFDTGVFFERELAFRGERMLQTLEPRAYYLFVPKRDQSDIPVFDSAALDFNASQLFRDNRFSGADRMGDANQLTLAVGSRLLEQGSGEQLVSANVGQILYFRDRDVTLPGQAVETESTSDIIGEFSAALPGPVSADATLHWDPNEGRNERLTVQLRYHPDRDHILNLGYRFRRGSVEQTDVSLRWRLARSWHFVGRWNYSLRDERNLEIFGGLEYDSCCWSVRVVGRDFLNDVNKGSNTALFVQVELKGLTSVGDRVESLLESGILGYER